MKNELSRWELTILDGLVPVKDLGFLAVGDMDGDGRNEVVTGGNGLFMWYRPATAEKGVVASGKHFHVGAALEDL